MIYCFGFWGQIYMVKKNVALGLYLKERRVSSGLSQNNVADKLGYTSAQFVSNWERGLCSPPMDILNKLIKLYKMDAKQLMKCMLEDTKRELAADFARHHISLPKSKAV